MRSTLPATVELKISAELSNLAGQPIQTSYPVSGAGFKVVELGVIAAATIGAAILTAGGSAVAGGSLVAGEAAEVIGSFSAISSLGQSMSAGLGIEAITTASEILGAGQKLATAAQINEAVADRAAIAAASDSPSGAVYPSVSHTHEQGNWIGTAVATRGTGAFRDTWFDTAWDSLLDDVKTTYSWSGYGPIVKRTVFGSGEESRYRWKETTQVGTLTTSDESVFALSTGVSNFVSQACMSLGTEVIVPSGVVGVILGSNVYAVWNGASWTTQVGAVSPDSGTPYDISVSLPSRSAFTMPYLSVNGAPHNLHDQLIGALF
jgi:hypothetical protein